MGEVIVVPGTTRQVSREPTVIIIGGAPFSEVEAPFKAHLLAEALKQVPDTILAFTLDKLTEELYRRLSANAVIRPKSEWQNDDCLFCHGVATLEAVYRKAPNVQNTIRCCEKPECQQKAKERAETT